jgi:hypothetical protein
MTARKQAIKEVTVLARVEFKCDSRKVVYKVLSSNEKDTYITTLFNGKACSCTCPATKPCYHMVQLEAREAARNAAPAAPIAAPQKEAWTAEEEKRYNAPLNSSNRGFSLMR